MTRSAPSPRAFPPLGTRTTPEGFHRNGRRHLHVRHCWGTLRVHASQLKAKDGSGYATVIHDPTLDHSAITPQALKRMTTLAAMVPFEEAAEIATMFNLNISSSELERVVAPLATSCAARVQQQLQHASEADPPTPRGAGRLWILELDGVLVLGKPHAGRCSGIEIKQIALYPYATPSERYVVADVMGGDAVRTAVLGLLRLAGVTKRDTLVGLGDGAAWVEATLDGVGDVCITDVFHAASYLETVLVALGWSESKRIATRRALCQGRLDMATLLSKQLPSPEVWLAWDEDAITALRYLESRVTRMQYPTFKALGYPIGSGMIEGLNKSNVGTRMKRSGMQWSRAGAGRMAALRAWRCSKHPLVTFDEVRHHAYPPPALEPVSLSA